MRILVCGGAGYIGSHMVKMLDGRGHRVTVFDNLSTGNRQALKWGRFIEGDLLFPKDLDRLFEAGPFDAVMHFCAKSIVPESIQEPAAYYRNNVTGTLHLLDKLKQHGVERFIFSSSAAVYGLPRQDAIDESHPLAPISPYGHTKAMVERVLSDYGTAYGLRSVSLRYFNAAGADLDGQTGERHDPETHLIPNVLKSLLGNGQELTLFGTDYDTPDGTCVRDYIHVNDLCGAHLLAMEYLETHDGAHVFNLGNGKGVSILEILNAAETVTGQRISCRKAGRRIGDPPTLVADSRKARDILGWVPKYSDIETILRTAWNWHQTHHLS